MRILMIAPVMALTLAFSALPGAAPAEAATPAACRALFEKMAPSGKYVTDKSFVAMMKKSGRKMANSSRISKGEFMQACYADVFERSTSS